MTGAYRPPVTIGPSLPAHGHCRVDSMAVQSGRA